MSKIIYLTPPAHGHVNPTLPVVQELIQQGVPLILIPQQFEQLLNARCVAARGAGLILEARLRHKAITADALRQALQSVLSDPRYREAARELQTAVRATGGYQQAADEIQAYIAPKTPV